MHATHQMTKEIIQIIVHFMMKKILRKSAPRTPRNQQLHFRFSGTHLYMKQQRMDILVHWQVICISPGNAYVMLALSTAHVYCNYVIIDYE